jgi:hypothetical protein
MNAERELTKEENYKNVKFLIYFIKYNIIKINI